MKQKSCGVVLVALLLALCFPAAAQQPTKIPRIGYVSGSGEPNTSSAFEQFSKGLRDLGYFAGKNILVEYRSAEGNLDRLPGLAAELVQLKVDVLIVSNLPAIRAAKEATKTIPIVMVTPLDPVAIGLVDNLARPGGNLTGLTTVGRELSGKRLELLKETVLGASRVGVLWNADAPGPVLGFKEYETAARALRIPLQSLEVRGPKPDLESAFQAAAKSRTTAIITITNPLLSPYKKQIANLAITNRKPSMCEYSEWVEAGCLMSYATNQPESFRRAAIYVDKILKGAKPADLPVEQPMKFELVINLKTAKQIGVTIPQSVLYRADKVIR